MEEQEKSQNINANNLSQENLSNDKPSKQQQNLGDRFFCLMVQMMHLSKINFTQIKFLIQP